MLPTGSFSNDPGQTFTEISQTISGVNPNEVFELSSEGSFQCCFDEPFEILENSNFSLESQGEILDKKDWYCIDSEDFPLKIVFRGNAPSKLKLVLTEDDTINSISLKKISNSSGEELQEQEEIIKNNSFNLKDTTFFDCFDSLSFDREDFIGWINDFEDENIYPLDTTIEELCDDDLCVGVNLYSVNTIQDWYYE